MIEPAARARLAAFASYARTVMIGTATGQVVQFLSAPLLSRLYGPAAFGFFAAYLAVTDTLGVAIAGRYDIAVLAAATRIESHAVVRAALATAVAASLAITIALVAWSHEIASALGQPLLAPWMPVAPVLLVAGAVQITVANWLTREGFFRDVAVTRIFRSVALVVVSLTAGAAISGTGGTLIASTLVAQTTSALFTVLVASTRGLTMFGGTRVELFDVAFRFRSFPFYSVPGALLNTATVQLPVIIMSPLYGPSVVGQFGMAQRILGAPLALVSNAFGDVFAERAGREWRATGSLRRSWNEAALLLVGASAVIAVTIWVASYHLFESALGAEWAPAAATCRALTPYFAMAFVASPLSRTFAIVARQDVYLRWQVLLFAVVALALAVASRAASPTTMIWAFSAAYASAYAVNIAISRAHSQPGQVLRSAPVGEE